MADASRLIHQLIARKEYAELQAYDPNSTCSTSWTTRSESPRGPACFLAFSTRLNLTSLANECFGHG